MKENTHFTLSLKTTFRQIIKPEILFVVFSLTFGLILVFLTPPMEVPDENVHFPREYQISDMNFIADKLPSLSHGDQTRYGAETPKSINSAVFGLLGDVPYGADHKVHLNTYRTFLRQDLDVHNTEPLPTEPPSTYSPIAYIPQVVGICVGKAFNAPPIVLIWLGRITNLIAFTVLIYFAIRLLPFAKWGLVLLALNPMSLFLGASLSPDALNISLAFLFVSLVVSTYGTKRQISHAKLILITGVLSALALSKPTGLVFAPLIFTIPWRAFTSRKKHISFVIISIGIAAVLFLLWNWGIRDIVKEAVFIQANGRPVSQSAQLAYILNHPLGYAKDLITNFVIVVPNSAGDSVFRQFWGIFGAGTVDAINPVWVMVVYAVMLVLAALYQSGRGTSLTTNKKLIFLSLFLIAAAGTITAMYLNFTNVGSSLIQGVQGRYFVPFSILLLALFTGRRKILNISDTMMGRLVGVVTFVTLSVTVVEITLRYYNL